MNWSSEWNTKPAQQQSPPVQPAQSFNPWDNMSRDELLIRWNELKVVLATAKENEMELRKYIVKRAFPNASEGMNTEELSNGYTLKASVKFNYKLEENEKIETGLERIARIGNQGAFIADRLVSWTPNFLLTEYRELQEEASKGSDEAKLILKEVESFLIITDAAPTLEIKEPKAKK